LGKIHAHKYRYCIPSGVYGTTSAAAVASQMLFTFQSIRFGLMVGIGEGAPTKEFDIRRKPTRGFGGVVQYDFGKAVGQGVFERTGSLNKPPQILFDSNCQIAGRPNYEGKKSDPRVSLRDDRHAPWNADSVHISWP
jgi:hypothetical protein